MGCPADLRFNPDKEYCDWQHNVAACADKSRIRVCEHKDLKISCDAGKTITIVDASYGRSEGREV